MEDLARMADAFGRALRRPHSGRNLPDAYLETVQADLSRRPRPLARDERESLKLATNELRARRAPWN